MAVADNKTETKNTDPSAAPTVEPPVIAKEHQGTGEDAAEKPVADADPKLAEDTAVTAKADEANKEAATDEATSTPKEDPVAEKEVPTDEEAQDAAATKAGVEDGMTKGKCRMTAGSWRYSRLSIGALGELEFKKTARHSTRSLLTAPCALLSFSRRHLRGAWRRQEG